MVWIKHSDCLLWLADWPDFFALDHQSIDSKPNGCWFSDESEDNWEGWVKERVRGDQSFYNWSAHLRYKYLLKIDESNIIKISTIAELDDFHKLYNRETPGAKYDWSWDRLIDWPTICEKSDGIIIAPYLYHRRLEWRWYYSWDVASGCIWNQKAIKEMKLIEIDLKAGKRRKGK